MRFQRPLKKYLIFIKRMGRCVVKQLRILTLKEQGNGVREKRDF